MKHFFDFCFGVILLIVLSTPMLIIALTIRITSKGPVIFWSDRVGLSGKIFSMPKFRTMFVNTEVLATDKLNNPNESITSIGRFLRKYSLDELPQLFLIIKGSMSFVGPRPALFNQTELIELRKNGGLDQVLPGLTGWAQVNGRDKISNAEKVALDLEYMFYKSFWFDIKILLITFVMVLKSADVSH